MAKKEIISEEIAESTVEATSTNPVADVLKSIATLPQVDRLVLYNRLDVIMNYDRDKASQGIDGGTHLFDEAIKSL